VYIKRVFKKLETSTFEEYILRKERQIKGELYKEKGDLMRK